MEKDYSSATYTMDSLAQGYRGISTYNSVLNGNLKEFVDVCYPELYYMVQNRYAFWPKAEDNFLAAFTGCPLPAFQERGSGQRKYELCSVRRDLPVQDVQEAGHCQILCKYLLRIH